MSEAKAETKFYCSTCHRLIGPTESLWVIGNDEDEASLACELCYFLHYQELPES